MLKTTLRILVLGWWIVPFVWIVGVPLWWLMIGENESPVTIAKWASVYFTLGSRRAEKFLYAKDLYSQALKRKE